MGWFREKDKGRAAEQKPGVKSSSSILPCFLFVEILVGELCAFFTKAEGTQEKTIVTADCCYFYPLLRRIVRFLGVYAFGLFTTTIFSNAGQVVTGNQTPHFLSACRPNYTALGCQSTMQYITERRACTGNPLIVMSARKSFPCKDAALSVYSALYTVMYVTLVFRTKGTRLTKPTISLTLLCLAMLVGVVRVAEYRNHWSDVLAGFFTGGAIAVFLVTCVINNFRQLQPCTPPLPAQHPESVLGVPMVSLPCVESPVDKLSGPQVRGEVHQRHGGHTPKNPPHKKKQIPHTCMLWAPSRSQTSVALAVRSNMFSFCFIVKRSLKRCL
ncbi:phospholipid phosphatase-related protein type 2a isoform X5 [Oryzias melastigma]|uniref:phospholipid phosphatase-related protein type 2a isoform X5 n=1 Tax=Oryzias melastigma TaxID=30732 RepID=UPI000CF7F86D|nr:phospholipid phosphatase-related protein type 2a isoform X5 [Oryzias melastigma]